MKLHKRALMFDNDHDLVVRIAIVAVCFLIATPIQALEYTISDKSILEVNAHIQLNALDGDDCDIDFCDEYESGVRQLDFDAKIRYFAGQKSQFYFGLDLDLSEKDDKDLTASTPRFGVEDTERSSSEDETVEQAYVGLAIEKVAIELGEMDPATSGFGVTNSNFLNYSLNAFNDDRAPEYELFKLESVRFSFLSNEYKLNLLVGAANGNDEDRDFDVDYEVLANFAAPPVPWFDLRAQIALRQVVDNTTNEESDSYGIRFSAFSKYGFNIGLGYSENELGDYTELTLKWIYKHRHQWGVGSGFFESDLSGVSKNTKRNIRDLDFWYLNYAWTISKSARVFLEFDQLEGNGETLDSLMGGIEFTF